MVLAEDDNAVIFIENYHTMKKLLLSLVTIASLHIANAQKIKWDKGGLDVLSGQTNLATEIVYENLQVSGMSEQQFLDERRKSDNAEKAGSGDLFCTKWDEAKQTKYSARLNDHIHKASKEKVTAGAGNADAKYKVILKPSNIDLGKGRYFGTKPALVDFDITIVENANPENVVAHGTAKEVKGESKAPKGSGWIPGGAGAAIDVANRSQNFDATNRIAESFELIAIAIGKAMKK